MSGEDESHLHCIAITQVFITIFASLTNVYSQIDVILQREIFHTSTGRKYENDNGTCKVGVAKEKIAIKTETNKFLKVRIMF